MNMRGEEQVEKVDITLAAFFKAVPCLLPSSLTARRPVQAGWPFSSIQQSSVKQGAVHTVSRIQQTVSKTVDEAVDACICTISLNMPRSGWHKGRPTRALLSKHNMFHDYKARWICNITLHSRFAWSGAAQRLAWACLA
eukprot:1156963-Pelagomonas_calceolata.AAC.2